MDKEVKEFLVAEFTKEGKKYEDDYKVESDEELVAK